MRPTDTLGSSWIVKCTLGRLGNAYNRTMEIDGCTNIYIIISNRPGAPQPTVIDGFRARNCAARPTDFSFRGLSPHTRAPHQAEWVVMLCTLHRGIVHEFGDNASRACYKSTQLDRGATNWILDSLWTHFLLNSLVLYRCSATFI